MTGGRKLALGISAIPLIMALIAGVKCFIEALGH